MDAYPNGLDIGGVEARLALEGEECIQARMGTVATGIEFDTDAGVFDVQGRPPIGQGASGIIVPATVEDLLEALGMLQGVATGGETTLGQQCSQQAVARSGRHERVWSWCRSRA